EIGHDWIDRGLAGRETDDAALLLVRDAQRFQVEMRRSTIAGGATTGARDRGIDERDGLRLILTQHHGHAVLDGKIVALPADQGPTLVSERRLIDRANEVLTQPRIDRRHRESWSARRNDCRNAGQGYRSAVRRADRRMSCLPRNCNASRSRTSDKASGSPAGVRKMPS